MQTQLEQSSRQRHLMASFWRVFNVVSAILFATLGLMSLATIVVHILDPSLLFDIDPLSLFVSAVMVVAAILYPFFALFCLCRVKHVYIILSPDGIEYHDVGLHIYTPWENIERIGLTRLNAQLGIGPESLVLRQPPVIRPSSWRWKLTSLPQGHSISLLEFGQWRHSNLGRDLKHYAPRLFQ